jgi:hypothetical protein
MFQRQTPRIKLLSFADGAFAGRKAAFEKQAEAFELFTEIEVHSRPTLDRTFFGKHKNFIESNEKGFGFYIWKPQIVLQSINDSSNFDLLCWLDAGFTLNPGGRKRFLDYVSMAQDSSYKMLSFFNVHTEYMWTKADLAERLRVNDKPEIMCSSQLSSGFFIMAPTRSNIRLIKDWAKISLENNYHYSSNEPSKHPNHEKFVEHRHDQSIFSLLTKKRGTASTFYEVQGYHGTFDRNMKSLPAWATRLRNQEHFEQNNDSK